MITPRQNSRRWKLPTGCRTGFTLVEMMIAMSLLTVVATVSVRTIGPVQSRLAVRSARAAVASVHARARSVAAERRELTTFGINAVRDSVWISVGDSLIQGLNTQAEFGVSIESSPPAVTLCLHSGGLADRGCNSFSSPVDLKFISGSHSRSAQLRTLGHLIMVPAQ